MQAARTELLEEKAALEGKVAQQQGKLAQYADNDPDRHKHIRELTCYPPHPLPAMRSTLVMGFYRPGKEVCWACRCYHGAMISSTFS